MPMHRAVFRNEWGAPRGTWLREGAQLVLVSESDLCMCCHIGVLATYSLNMKPRCFGAEDI